RLREEPATLAPAQHVLVAATGEAANDGSFRWKLVAGAASFAAVSAIAWTLIGTAPGRPDGAQLAASRTAGGTVLTSSERGVMIRDPRLDEFMAAHRQLGGATLVAPAGYLRSYVGTFVVSSIGGGMSSARIWHAQEGDVQVERVEALTGAPRSVFRRNEQVVTFFPEAHVVRTERRESLGLFTSLLKSSESA